MLLYNITYGQYVELSVLYIERTPKEEVFYPYKQGFRWIKGLSYGCLIDMESSSRLYPISVEDSTYVNYGSIHFDDIRECFFERDLKDAIFTLPSNSSHFYMKQINQSEWKISHLINNFLSVSPYLEEIKGQDKYLYKVLYIYGQAIKIYSTKTKLINYTLVDINKITPQYHVSEMKKWWPNQIYTNLEIRHMYEY